MEQEQGETNMVEIKDTELTPMTKEEFRAWEDYVIKYNYDNSTDQIAYEVVWNKDEYKVKLLNLKVDNEG
jgi:hypothetical protein